MPFAKGYTPHNKKIKDPSMKAPVEKKIEPPASKEPEFTQIIRGLTNGTGGTVVSGSGVTIESAEHASNIDKIMKDNNQELVERVDFFDGKNKLSIAFIKKNSRMFRIQIFLNDSLEIRPVTYNGRSPASAYWELLKSELKK